MGREKVFRFKQFSVLNDKTAMKVGTDGVLLGSWCDVDDAATVLDVGTGSGVIALMIAQRNSHAMIQGIDIDEQAVAEAALNFRNSPWTARLRAKVQDFNSTDGDERYDLIVANPPFFDNGVLPPSQARMLARHTSALTLDQLISRSSCMLSHGGILSFIAPATAEPAVRRCLASVSLYVKRMATVVPVEGAEPKRIMLEVTNQEVTTACETITIQTASRHYTRRYIELTHDFYLKM